MEVVNMKKGKVVSIKGIQYEVVKEVLGTVILNQKGTARLYRMDDNNMFSLRSLQDGECMLKIVRQIHEINKKLDIYKRIGKYAHPMASDLKCEKYALMMMLREYQK